MTSWGKWSEARLPLDVKTALFALATLALVGCATPERRPVEDDQQKDFLRGKFANYSPIVVLRCRSDFHAADFPDLQDHFLTPLEVSVYRLVIDRIEIDATCEEAAQWTAELYLNTGARIALTGYGEFHDSNASSAYDAARRRVFSKLEEVRRRDPKLRLYIDELRRRIALNARRT